MSILDIVFPRICVGCGREGEYICIMCRLKLVRPEPICPMCGKLSLDGKTHARCIAREGMEGLWVGLPYKGMVQQCLKKVKYKSAWEIIGFLYGLCQFDDLRDWVITSVPMWGEKERERGFNQADIVARLVAEKNKVPYLVTMERTRETRPMFGLKKKERRENVEGAFEISKQLTANSLQQKRVILVDDVWTTGATMRECTRVLKEVGAGEVWGLTLAR